ncbi:MAG TPA: LysR substrate-binding domain-containing protein [Accumulibacter sp.]|uniref:LysR family transcriptional regulator n=1 Tax=Accumulibacter sp. TaxID=2053492 RepID=UPI002C6542A8|nr:LysR substrate-binding domain-containing protein [Accumulibacter sp.]HMW64414.1 LysR substrate-binding domain-containing protein [Accumulibacter sp.]HMW80579.1 LysR substrate-binding domain-containing protein [Accumulibacter sp.]HMX69239.1 LysR substrate-binding domain-containing protein [Accumulibacter sp.]HNC27883.1 LysR substrate-binding domain-containing protein [Accumulibacter sp.]HND40021.1 LysR substrate-binding domain-containing protein [Accumulibacter sp.]
MPRRRISFRQLETFTTVARLRSFTKAAAALHLTQPAVSLQIRQLAEVLGVPLFAQQGRLLVLTQAGEEVLKMARELDDVWNRFEAAIDELKGLKRGRLRIALVPTAKYFLPRMLGDFCRRYPEIEVELEIAERERVVARLRGNQDDLYIMVYPPDDLPLICTPFLDNEQVVIAPVGHWAAGRKLALDELSGERFILREVGSGSRRTIDSHLAQTGIRLDVKLAVSSNEAIRELVATGVGLAVLSRHALPADPAAAGVCMLEVEGFPLRRPWLVVQLRNKTLSLPARAFLAHLLEAGGAAATAPAAAAVGASNPDH